MHRLLVLALAAAVAAAQPTSPVGFWAPVYLDGAAEPARLSVLPGQPFDEAAAQFAAQVCAVPRGVRCGAAVVSSRAAGRPDSNDVVCACVTLPGARPLPVRSTACQTAPFPRSWRS